MKETGMKLGVVLGLCFISLSACLLADYFLVGCQQVDGSICQSIISIDWSIYKYISLALALISASILVGGLYLCIKKRSADDREVGLRIEVAVIFAVVGTVALFVPASATFLLGTALLFLSGLLFLVAEKT
jgi:hypothetical protein